MPSFPTADPAVLDRLRQFDTPTVCNVIELFDFRPRTVGYMDGRIQACYPKLPPMVGYASTATFHAGSPPRGGDVYAGLGKQVELIAGAPGPAVIVFQDIDDPVTSATFGEVMCTTYMEFGAGADHGGKAATSASRSPDFLLHRRLICSHGYSQIVHLTTPVRVGGITVNPGDLLHGDRNGVTTIPTELASAVADACPELMAAEAVVLDYVKAGNPDPKGYAGAREECHRRMEAMAVRLRKLVKR